MKKSDIEEMIELIEKDDDLKFKFARLLESIMEDDLSLNSKIADIVAKKLGREAKTLGI
jgi:hypothetical protein